MLLYGRLDLGFHGIEVEARALLQGRIFDGGPGELGHFLLDEDEPPELIHEPAHEISLRALQGPVFRIAQALERIEAQVRQGRRVEVVLDADPAVGLVDEAVLEVIDAHRAQRAFAEVEDLVPGLDGPLPVIRSSWL